MSKKIFAYVSALAMVFGLLVSLIRSNEAMAFDAGEENISLTKPDNLNVEEDLGMTAKVYGVRNDSVVVSIYYENSIDAYLSIDSSCLILREGQQVSLSEICVGDWINFNYKRMAEIYPAHIYGCTKIQVLSGDTKASQVAEENKNQPVSMETTQMTSENKNQPVSIGTTLKDNKGVTYTVIAEGKLAYCKPSRKSVKTVVIPEIAKIAGSTYRVEAIAYKAFSGCKKLKSVKISKNITSIGAKAFYHCKRLKTIVIKTKKLTSESVGKKVCQGINDKARIKVPAAKKKSYKKFFAVKHVKIL